MHAQDIKLMIESNLPNSTAMVTGEDGHHFEALVVCPDFEGMNLIARQRAIYQTLGDNIRNGNIHALSLKAKTPNELQLEGKS